MSESAERNTLLSSTFFQLADSLTAEFDIVDILTVLVNSVTTLFEAATAAGILLSDGSGTLHVMASSSEDAHLLELYQLQNEEGPCLDCVRTGEATGVDDLQVDRRWPRFAAAAAGWGFGSAHAFPLRMHDRVLGAVNVFGRRGSRLPERDRVATQALADVASVALVQHHAARSAELVVAQLRGALNSRIAIEQAKGVLAERAGVTTAEAFTRLRSFARAHNLLLSDLAAGLVNNRLPPEVVEALVSDEAAPCGPQKKTPEWVVTRID